MKKRRPPSPILKLLNSYNGALGLYLLLRFLFGARWWWLGVLHTFAFWLFVPLLIIILLALILRGKRTVAISFLLLMVGIIRFAPLQAGVITTSDAPHDLRVLTFNVWNINPQIEESIDWVLTQDADVIILQEVVGGHLNQIPRLLAVYPHQEFVEGSIQIFSRYPFLEDDVIGIEAASATWDGRLAVRTVIDVDGQAVTVYGVHLSLPKRENPHFGITTGIDSLDFILHYDESHRNRQIINLAEMAEAETNPVIIAGDFNTSHSSPILNNLTEIGMRDAFSIVGTGWGMSWSHNPPDLPLIRIDYIWSSKTLRPLRIERSDFIGSDHLALVADFAFSE